VVEQPAADRNTAQAIEASIILLLMISIS